MLILAELSRADYALLVALVSALIAVSTLLWNVYESAVLDRARIKVKVSTGLAAVSAADATSVVIVSATNLGKRPARVALLTVVARPANERWWRRLTGRWKNGQLIVPPFAGLLPVWQSGVLEVGDEATTLIDLEWLRVEARKLNLTKMRGQANTVLGSRVSRTMQIP